MSIAVMNAVWESCLYQGGVLNVLLAMADCAGNPDGSQIFPGNEYLAAKCRQSVRATLDSIKRLRRDGVIKQIGDDGEDLPSEENYPGGRGRKAEYRIDLERMQELQSLHEAENPDCEVCRQHRVSAEKRRRRKLAKGADLSAKGEPKRQKGEVSGSHIEEEPSEPSNILPAQIETPSDARAMEARIAALRKELGEAVFRAWFDGAVFGEKVIALSKRFKADWVARHFSSVIERVFGEDVSIIAADDPRRGKPAMCTPGTASGSVCRTPFIQVSPCCGA